MKHMSDMPHKSIWLDQPHTGDAASCRQQAILCQLCSRDTHWQQAAGYVCCNVASTDIQKDANEYNKFFRMLYIQGIIDGGFFAGCYPHDNESFQLRMSLLQLEQMQHHYTALMRWQRGHHDTVH